MERIEFVSVAGGKYHRVADNNLERDNAFKPRLMLCGRMLKPMNYFQSADDANKFTGGRLAQHVCRNCESHISHMHRITPTEVQP